jgi:hypothetical protein
MIVNQQYTATAEATAVRLVACEECDTEYVYQLERSAEGYGNSIYMLDNAGAKKRAMRKAKDDLARKMKNACEAIPCPECGHVQDHMLGKARFDRAVRIGLFAILTVLLMIGMLFVGQYTRLGKFAYALSGLSCLATIGVGIFALVAYSSYNPNRKPEAERIAYGQENATLRKDFEKAFAAAAEDAFEEFCGRLGKKKAKTRFEMPVWVDRGQLKGGETVKPRLPDGERVSIRLKADDRDGDEFPFAREVDGHEIQVVCVLNVYTKNRS